MSLASSASAHRVPDGRCCARCPRRSTTQPHAIAGYCFVSGDTERWRTVRGDARRVAASGAVTARGRTAARRSGRPHPSGRRAISDRAPRRLARRRHARVALRRRRRPSTCRAISSEHRPSSARSGARAIVTAARLAAPLDRRARRRTAGDQPAADRCCILDDLDAAPLEPDFAPALDDVALVQFTSGSTASPKGVTLTHANLRRTSTRSADQTASPISRDDVGVSWLPLSHDMGLVGMALGAALCGAAVRAAAAAGVRQAAGGVAACDHAASRDGQLRAELRLRPLRPPGERYSGARSLELARRRVRRRADSRRDARGLFRRSLPPRDFARRAYVPCYGLAEHVLAATVSPRGRRPRVEHVSADELTSGRIACEQAEGDRSVALVSCGPSLPGHQLRIVERRRPAGRESGTSEKFTSRDRR